MPNVFIYTEEANKYNKCLVGQDTWLKFTQVSALTREIKVHISNW